jgi:hypothetical protein
VSCYGAIWLAFEAVADFPRHLELLAERVGRHRIAFTVEAFRDLLGILKERLESRAKLIRLVLTDELLTLPVLVHALVEAQQRAEEHHHGRAHGKPRLRATRCAFYTPSAPRRSSVIASC